MRRVRECRTMSTEQPTEPNRSTLGQPAWEIAQLFPMQGDWSEVDYIGLSTNHLIELSDGKLEVLFMPTEWHQLIVLWIYRQLLAGVEQSRLGMVLVAPIRVRVGEGKFREPDIVFMLSANFHRRTNKFWNGADLVMEVVSDDDPDRDLVTKRREYALANIPEYWIVDPRDRSITVLTLDEGSQNYCESGRFTEGQIAQSKLLEGFAISVLETFAEKI